MADQTQAAHCGSGDVYACTRRGGKGGVGGGQGGGGGCLKCSTRVSTDSKPDAAREKHLHEDVICSKAGCMEVQQ